MMNRPAAFLALGATTAVFPVTAWAFGLPDSQLGGAEVAPELPRVSLASWASGDAQKAFTRWFESRLGLRGVLVRSDNSLMHLLGETKPDSRVKLANWQTFFVDDDIEFAATRVERRPIAVMEAHAAAIGAAQRSLAEHGLRLVVILAPAKAALYFDEVPSRWRGRTHERQSSGDVLYRAFRDALEREGVSFADGHRILTSNPDERELLFPRLGRHWSQLGACRVLRDALPSLMPSTCDYMMVTVDPHSHSDFDLYQLENTWFSPAISPSAPLLKEATPPKERPRALFMGTSFSWQLIDVVRPYVTDPLFFYYNSTIFDVTTRTPSVVGRVDPTSAAWARAVSERDLIVLEVLEVFATVDPLFTNGDPTKDFLEQVRGLVEHR
jgi:hypothetical protein